MLAISISVSEDIQSLPAIKKAPLKRKKNPNACNLFVDAQFHWIEVGNPDAYAESFWSTEHGNHPRCYHRLDQKIYASLLSEIAQLRNRWIAGDVSNLTHQACEDRFQQIEERVGQYFKDENLPALVHKHPKFPAPSINWDLVAM
ncbi:MAG: hypothetical protein RL553_538 [Planctomycetota bacterium]|jgi:hypothetical protein